MNKKTMFVEAIVIFDIFSKIVFGLLLPSNIVYVTNAIMGWVNQTNISEPLIHTWHNYMATYLPSRKLSKFDEPGVQYTAGEAGTSS